MLWLRLSPRILDSWSCMFKEWFYPICDHPKYDLAGPYIYNTLWSASAHARRSIGSSHTGLSCADPEHFFRRGPTLTTFFSWWGENWSEYQYIIGVSLAGRWWLNIECWLGSFAVLQGIRTSIAKKPYILWFFRGMGSGPPAPPPPLDPNMTFAPLKVDSWAKEWRFHIWDNVTRSAIMNIFRKKNHVKSFVKIELNYALTIHLFTKAKTCTEKWIILYKKQVFFICWELFTSIEKF